MKQNPAEFGRSFLPPDLQITHIDLLKPYATQLLAQPLTSLKELQTFLEKYAEMVSVVSETGSRLYIDMTCYTQNEEYSESYLNFIENISPLWEEWLQELHKKIDQCPFKKELDPALHGEWLLGLSRKIALFRQENIDLQTQIALCSKKYQELMGSLTALWEDEEKTLSQLEKILESPNRAHRERAWRLITQTRLSKATELNTLFLEMKVLREKTAHNAGYENYIPYIFALYDRTDYSPADCQSYHNQILKTVVPLYTSIQEKRKEALGIPHLKPWDLACSTQGLEALKPFNDDQELCRKIGQSWEEMNPEFADFFKIMQQKGLLDLANRKGKAPGGYQSGLEEQRLPFIFMNAVGSHKDLMTLFHECGHSWHEFYTRNLNLSETRHAPMEFCEVASMSMERAGLQYLEAFYSKSDQARAIAQEEEEVLRLLIWVALVDNFQMEIYTLPQPSTQDIQNTWCKLYKTYFPFVNWEGLDEELKNAWHKQLHIFEYPFYYIEYGIAQLGALQWQNQFLQNPSEALHRYRNALALGGTQSLRKLFAAAGLKFSLDENVVEPLAQACFRRWQSFQK